MKTIFHFCRPYLKPFRGLLCLLIGLSILLSFAAMISPYLIGSFIDQLLSSETVSFIWCYPVLLAVLAAFEFAVTYVCERIYIRVQVGSGYALNADALRHMQNVQFSYVHGKNTAFLNQQINSDATSAVVFCITVLQNIITNGFMLFVPILLIISFEPWLGCCMTGLNLLYFALYSIFRKPVYRSNYALMEKQAEFFSKLDEQIANVKFIQLQGLSNNFIRRLDWIVKDLLGKALKSQQSEYGFIGSDMVIKAGASITVFLLGGKAVIDRQMSVGELTIVMSYFAMSLSATQYFFSLGKNIQSARVSCDRLRKIFAEQEQTNGTMVPDDIETVECTEISFSYGAEKVLDSISLSFRKGGIYAFVGENGAGKSTLINLLLGLFIDSYSGSILYNGIPIENLDMRELRHRLVGVSEQEPILLEETLRFNLTLDDAGTLSEYELSRLAKMLHLDTLLATLPNGLNTIVCEGSSNFSGGEKQKISIIRALLKHPKLLVLDEPTSALDQASREGLITYLWDTRDDRIVFLSTHDNELINICSEVIHL